MKISYAVTVHNEHEELDRLLSVLSEWIRGEDEVVVLRDARTTSDVIEVLERFEDIFECEYSHRNTHALDNDFASHKNALSQACTGDYIFQIDADEYPSEELVDDLPELLAMNGGIDLLLIPRINTVDGLTFEHIAKWGWNVNEDHWVNFPDLQSRVYRNTPDIYWVNRVHERIIGYEKFAELSYEDGYVIYHPKDIERQVAQNELYSEILDF